MAAYVPQFHIGQKATYTVHSLSINIGAGYNFHNAILPWNLDWNKTSNRFCQKDKVLVLLTQILALKTDISKKTYVPVNLEHIF